MWAFEHAVVPFQKLVEKSAIAVAADSGEKAQSHPASLARHTDGQFIEAGWKQRGGDGFGKQLLEAIIMEQRLQRIKMIGRERPFEHVEALAVPLFQMKPTVVLDQDATGMGTGLMCHAKDKVERGPGRVLSDELCGHDEQQENESNEG